MQQICADLMAEQGDLDSLVARLDDASWDLPTPAAGWTVRDQLSHLGYFDRTAVAAITDPDGFAVGAAALLADGVDRSVEPGRGRSPSELLAWWRAGRAALLDALG